MHLKHDDKNASCVDGARALKCLWVGSVLQTDAQPSANVGADDERALTRFKRLVPLLSRRIHVESVAEAVGEMWSVQGKRNGRRKRKPLESVAVVSVISAVKRSFSSS